MDSSPQSANNVITANDAKLLARYFVGRKGNALVDGLINPLDDTITRHKPFQKSNIRGTLKAINHGNVNVIENNKCHHQKLYLEVLTCTCKQSFKLCYKGVIRITLFSFFRQFIHRCS